METDEPEMLTAAPIDRQPDPARKRRNLDEGFIEDEPVTTPPEITEDTGNPKSKKRKKKNKGKEKLTLEELANYDAEDLVNYITGGRRKD